MLNIFYGRLAALFLLTFVAVPAAADPNNPIPKLFQWKFADSTLSESLPTCTQLGIIVESEDVTTNSTIGVPPYYMISYAVDSTPVTQLIGEDQNNLQWTIIQPVGSQLLLSVVDSQGNPGGSPPYLITVIPGQTTQCVSTPLNTPEFTVSSNVTRAGNLNTCSPWGLTITGGSPPYVVTIVETAEPVVTNVTVPFGNNRFTYINRAVAGGQMIAGVSDLTGRWASGTPLVKPVGSLDTDCIGLTSSSGNATVIDAQDKESDEAAAAAAHRREAVKAIVAIVVILVFGIAIFIAGWNMIKRRRRRQNDRLATVPTQFSTSPETQATQVGAGTGWVITSDRKSNRRDVEAPPYREYDPVTGAGPSGSRGTEVPPVSASSNRPILPRLDIASTTPMIVEKPARYLSDTTPAVPPSSSLSLSTALPSSRIIPNSANSRKISPTNNGNSARNSHFAAFPVTSVRKITTGTGRSLSVSATAAGGSVASSNAAGVSRNATYAAGSLAAMGLSSSPQVNPFIIEEEDVISNRPERDSDVLTASMEGLPPRYRSLKYKDSGRQQ